MVLIAAGIGAGCVGAIARAWHLRARIFALEDVVAELETSFIREIKRRAAFERIKKADKPLELEELAQNLQNLPAKPTFEEWRWKRGPKSWWDFRTSGRGSGDAGLSRSRDGAGSGGDDRERVQ